MPPGTLVVDTSLKRAPERPTTERQNDFLRIPMFGWLSSRRNAPATPAPAVMAAAPVPVAEPAPSLPAAPEAAALSTLSWLLDGPPPLQTPPGAHEKLLLQGLDHQLATSRLSVDLLPRAAAVIPQLLALMRQEAPQRSAIVQQVLKDLLLTAEVLRVARSPFYGAQPVDTIETALDRIGTTGLHAAMARVLLKPVFQAQGESLTARAAPRLWQRAEYKSMLCADLMARDGGDRFEGFLAGLLHDTGWLALLRLIDRAGLHPELPLSRALDLALDRRKDRLFGRLVAEWDLSPALTTLAKQMQAAPMSSVALPLAEALRTADRTSTLDLSTGA
jgi:HD-like signal output (HDOD) protein